jgi:hypothetical protein
MVRRNTRSKAERQQRKPPGQYAPAAKGLVGAFPRATAAEALPNYRLTLEVLGVGLIALTGPRGGFLSGVNVPGSPPTCPGVRIRTHPGIATCGLGLRKS